MKGSNPVLKIGGPPWREAKRFFQKVPTPSCIE